MQVDQLGFKELDIPVRVFACSVIGNPVGLDLSLRETRATWTGTCFSASCFAAKYRTCPTIMTSFLSTTMGCRKPNAWMESATLSIAF